MFIYNISHASVFTNILAQGSMLYPHIIESLLWHRSKCQTDKPFKIVGGTFTKACLLNELSQNARNDIKTRLKAQKRLNRRRLYW